MTTNILNHKVLFNNFDILRKSKRLTKGEFNKLIGINNVFRPNYFSIGAKLLKGIQDNFPGITEEWLLTPHDVDYEFPELQKLKQATGTNVMCETPHSPVFDSQSPYLKTIRISDPLIQKTAAILESPTIFSTALKSNIEAFHHAMVCEEKLTVALKRIDDLEEHVKQIEKRLPAIVNGS